MSAFVTGEGLAACCRHVFDGTLTAQPEATEDWWFCKLDHLEEFVDGSAPRRPFVLVTHNSDYPVDLRYRRLLRSRRIRTWFAANVALEHRKLVPLPLGIANPHWAHGNPASLRAAQVASRRKSILVDVSFSLATNSGGRQYCLEQTGLELAPRLAHPDYLQRLASSYFCVSPSGHGIDTHRTWEALYVRTVPIVTRSRLTDEYGDLPWIVLEDWSQFRSLELSPVLYGRLMSGWDPAAMSLEALVDRMRRRLG